MKKIAIQAENISKQYRLGEVGTGTISHDINRWWAKVRGKEDPFLKIGESNDRATKGVSDYVWSLRDINFEIEAGDAVGIIGRNGAGKSTLLKLLSKVTKPTTGTFKVKGRIASLLEVGTGFHPEMTGRENIYLNGAILGMRKHEIRRKFDEIVDFAGVERYIDTPVKRYSSGMYVRLAFAVAAHLESEILIVDEVLAVGDAEFQKKCLGKMGDVSKNEGRTVLFVSHNITAVSTLCDKGIFLNKGKIFNQGDIETIIADYFANTKENNSLLIKNRLDKIGNKLIEVNDIVFKNYKNEEVDEIGIGETLSIEFHIECSINDIDWNQVIVACNFSNTLEQRIISWVSDEVKIKIHSLNTRVIRLHIPSLSLRPDIYNFGYQISYKSTAPQDFCDVLKNVRPLTVLNKSFFKENNQIRTGSEALIYAEFEYNYKFN
jgi:lipopolysaccharide transport system ATP-binding protein